MKKVKVYLTALLFSLIFFTGCVQDPARYDTISTEDVLTHSSWSVDYYFQNQDLTDQFGNCRLLFSTTGTVAVQKETETLYGTWNKTTDNNAEFIHIHFTTSDPTINLLGQDWKLMDKSSVSLLFQETDPTLTNLRIKKQ